jgi:hypothetical protein
VVNSVASHLCRQSSGSGQALHGHLDWYSLQSSYQSLLSAAHRQKQFEAVVIIACMRKLLTIINVMVRDNKLGTIKAQPVSA